MLETNNQYEELNEIKTTSQNNNQQELVEIAKLPSNNSPQEKILHLQKGSYCFWNINGFISHLYSSICFCFSYLFAFSMASQRPLR